MGFASFRGETVCCNCEALYGGQHSKEGAATMNVMVDDPDERDVRRRQLANPDGTPKETGCAAQHIGRIDSLLIGHVGTAGRPHRGDS